MFNIKFAKEYIWTLDLWYWKQLLYQLSHNSSLPIKVVEID